MFEDKPGGGRGATFGGILYAVERIVRTPQKRPADSPRLPVALKAARVG